MEQNKYDLDYARPEDLDGFVPAYKNDEIFFNDIKHYIKTSPALTLKYAGKPIALGGFVPAWEGVLTSWNIVSKDAKNHKKAVFSAIKEGFGAMIESFRENGFKIHRLQAAVVLSRPEAVKLNYILGYKPEAVLRKYDRLGNDCLIMSKIFNSQGGTKI